MNRVHLHLKVSDLAASVDFYTRLFGSTPDIRKPDYAHWSLASPALNLALSDRTAGTGVAHLGIETDEPTGVDRLAAAVEEELTLDEGRTTCCYARSDKRWVADPDGLAWELFHTEARIDRFSEAQHDAAADADAGRTVPAACCPTG